MVPKHNAFLGTYCTELELISLTLYPPVLLLLTVTKTVDSMVQELFIVNLTSCQNLFNHYLAKKKKTLFNRDCVAIANEERTEFIY